MNAFITKISFYFNAHKFKVLIALVVFNGILLFTAHQSKVQLFGKVEAMKNRWATYTQLYKDDLESRIHYSAINAAETEFQALNYKYEYSKSKGNEYIVLGYEQPVTVRHSRVFYLDNQCSLVFFGKAERTLKNMTFRCLY
ncbi:hypothetical protein [Vibrio jasicida]|uniref:hypothetical protein n=1 Tax=Vibrio jasicida TaxID=766224 RepID=UPI0007AFE15C|nr:hypothetical protein [Vibrio jasicida]PAW12406.1 hypothetical protein B6K85_01210 [Vibrio sp. V1B]